MFKFKEQPHGIQDIIDNFDFTELSQSSSLVLNEMICILRSDTDNNDLSWRPMNFLVILQFVLCMQSNTPHCDKIISKNYPRLDLLFYILRPNLLSVFEIMNQNITNKTTMRSKNEVGLFVFFLLTICNLKSPCEPVYNWIAH